VLLWEEATVLAGTVTDGVTDGLGLSLGGPGVKPGVLVSAWVLVLTVGSWVFTWSGVVAGVDDGFTGFLPSQKSRNCLKRGSM
jgi:hypothetical protein